MTRELADASYMDKGTLSGNGSQVSEKVQIVANAKASEAHCGADRLQCEWSGDLWTAEAVAFIASQSAAAVDHAATGAAARGSSKEAVPVADTNAAAVQQPWMLYLSYTAPHAGGVGTNNEGQPPVPRISSGPYANRSKELGKEIGYASAVTEIDRQLGLVMAAVEQAGLTSDTVVFFASDNGARSVSQPGSEPVPRGRQQMPRSHTDRLACSACLR